MDFQGSPDMFIALIITCPLVTGLTLVICFALDI